MARIPRSNRQQRVRGRRTTSGSGNDTCRHAQPCVYNDVVRWSLLKDDVLNNYGWLKPIVRSFYVKGYPRPMPNTDCEIIVTVYLF